MKSVRIDHLLGLYLNCAEGLYLVLSPVSQESTSHPSNLVRQDCVVLDMTVFKTP